MPKTKSNSEEKEKICKCGHEEKHHMKGAITGCCPNSELKNSDESWRIDRCSCTEYSPVGAGENGMEAMKRAKTVGKGPYVGVKIADNIPTNPAPTSSLTDDEILKIIADKYPNGFPEVEDDYRYFKALTKNEILGIFKEAYQRGRDAPRTYSDEDIGKICEWVTGGSAGDGSYDKMIASLSLKSEADVKDKAVKEFCEKIRKILKNNKKRKSYLRFKKMSPYFRACVILDEAIKEARDGK